MQNDIRELRKGDKINGWLLLGWGLLSLVTGWVCPKVWPGLFWDGFQAVALPFGLVYLLKGFRALLQKEFSLELLSQEVRRLWILRSVSLLLFFLGLLLVFLGSLGNWGEFTLGTGIAMSLQTGLLLIIQLMEEWRKGLALARLKRKESPSAP